LEEQFYIFYPPLLYGLYHWSHKDRRRLVAGVFAIFVISLVLNLCFISRQPEAAFYLLHTRAWELLAGALTFLYLQNARLTKPAAEAAGTTGFVLLLLAFICYDRNTPFPGSAAIAPVLGTVLLLWANLQARTVSGRVLCYKPVIATGLISYGLYLYHWPVLVFARYYLERDLTALETAFALALVGAIAAASYFLVEQPIRERKQLVSRPAIFSVSLAGLLLTAVIGVAGTKTDGFPHRFSGPVLQYVTDDKAPQEDCTPIGVRKRDRAQLCKMGVPGRPDFILWGDSHADKMSPGLDAVAREKRLAGLKLWSPGCPPLLHLDRVGSEKYRCADDNDRALKVIHNSKVKIVILVGRWDVIFPPERGDMEAIRDARGPRVKLLKDSRELYDLPAFAEAFRDTIAALKSQGVHVYVVKQVPAHLQYVSSALAKYTALDRDTGVLKRPLPEVLQRRAPIDLIFDAVHDPAVTFIDPAKRFCQDGKSCIVEANGRSLYLDDTHLSLYGAMWVKNIWEQIFRN
jgi:hypothetical protein